MIYIFQLVAVEYKKQHFRGVIENICTEDFGEDDSNNLKTFQCWLIDYGTMVESQNIFRLPLSLRKTPPLSLQVSLCNIGYIHEVKTPLMFNFFNAI